MKLGKIKISDVLMHENPLELLPVMRKMVPLHIESRPHMRDFVYTAVSKEFDDIPEAAEIPFYDCILTTNKNKTISVKFERL